MSINRHSYVGFYPSDWLGGTARMTRLHKSVYFDVCCYIWDQNRPCPASELPLMLGDLSNWRDLVDDLVLAGKLVRSGDGSLCNERALSEANKAFVLWQKKSRGGRVGADKTNAKSGSGAGSGDGSPAGSGDGTSPKTAGSPVAEPEPEPDSSKEEVDGVAGARAHEVDPFGDIGALTARCGRAAGVPIMPNRKNFPDQLDEVRSWVAMGLDPDTEIIPELERYAIADSEPRHSLRYFTPAMAKIAARKDAQANGRHHDRPNLRGSRPDPALDMLRAAERAEEAERAASGRPDRGPPRLALPSR